MKLCIDGDIIIYQAAAGAQNIIDWGDERTINTDMNKAKATVRQKIREYQKFTGCAEFLICLSSPKNFRKDVWPDYKANRKGGERPVLLPELRAWVEKSFPFLCIEGLEADDLLSILSTRNPNAWTIATMDKDLKGTPGRLMKVGMKGNHEILNITPEEAKRFHYIQTMTGDGADGVPGVFGVGIKKAEKYIEKYGNRWEAVKRCYLDNGLTEEEAIRNGIMVKMLDKDLFENNVIKIWSPPND